MFFRAHRTNENEGTFTAALQLFWTTYFAGQVLQGIRMSNHSSTCSAVSLWNSKTLPDLERSQRRPGLVTCIQCFIKAVRYLFWWSDGFPASVIEWWRLAVVVSGLHNGFSVAHLRLFLLGCFATFFPHDRFSISLLRNILLFSQWTVMSSVFTQSTSWLRHPVCRSPWPERWRCPCGSRSAGTRAPLPGWRSAAWRSDGSGTMQSGRFISFFQQEGVFVSH